MVKKRQFIRIIVNKGYLYTLQLSRLVIVIIIFFLFFLLVTIIIVIVIQIIIIIMMINNNHWQVQIVIINEMMMMMMKRKWKGYKDIHLSIFFFNHQGDGNKWIMRIFFRQFSLENFSFFNLISLQHNMTHQCFFLALVTTCNNALRIYQENKKWINDKKKFVKILTS